MYYVTAGPPLGQTLNLKGCTGVLCNCWTTSRTSPTQTDWGIWISQLLVVLEEETLLMPACTSATCVKSKLLSSPWHGLVHMTTVKKISRPLPGTQVKNKSCHYTESCSWLEQFIWCCCRNTQLELFLDFHLEAHWRNLTSVSEHFYTTPSVNCLWNAILKPTGGTWHLFLSIFTQHPMWTVCGDPSWSPLEELDISFWEFLHNTQCELFVESHLEAHWRNLTSLSEHFSLWIPSYVCIN